MSPERWAEVRRILDAALELAPPERDRFVRQAAADDADLESELESLLAASGEASDDFLEAPAIELSPAEITGSPIGRRIGSYELVELIGEGGMGEVYRAVRIDDQYRSQVAIKLLAAGAGSGFVLSRFRNERQILASLDHPHIARLLDGGTTPEGAPYFVMELIEGEAIDRYCAER